MSGVFDATCIMKRATMLGKGVIWIASLEYHKIGGHNYWNKQNCIPINKFQFT